MAVEESRVLKDWMLCPRVFRKVSYQLGPLEEVDLFASRLSTQLPTFVSWRPDPEAMAMDAFMISWTGMKAYANPPWSVVGRVLAQVQQQEADIILIPPVWKYQPWYQALLEMCVDLPRLLPMVDNLIQPTHPQSKPDLLPKLAPWSISGKGTNTNSFQRKLQNSCSHRGERTKHIYESIPEMD